MKIKTNYHRSDLYCCECKERVAKGEKYALVPEELSDESILKEYHLSCVPDTEEDYWDDVNGKFDIAVDSDEEE